MAPSRGEDPPTTGNRRGGTIPPRLVHHSPGSVARPPLARPIRWKSRLACSMALGGGAGPLCPISLSPLRGYQGGDVAQRLQVAGVKTGLDWWRPMVGGFQDSRNVGSHVSPLVAQLPSSCRSHDRAPRIHPIVGGRSGLPIHEDSRETGQAVAGFPPQAGTPAQERSPAVLQACPRRAVFPP
jgi:hypothetical protein